MSQVYISRGSGRGTSLGAGNAWVIYHDANHENNFTDPELNIRRLNPHTTHMKGIFWLALKLMFYAYVGPVLLQDSLGMNSGGQNLG